MTAVPKRDPGPQIASQHDGMIHRARSILQSEMDVLSSVRDSLSESFPEAVGMLLSCRGKVVTCGIGKAGIVAQKLAASLSSTGTPSQFLHPSEAIHGDLGCLQPWDLVVLLSYSGETEEVTRILPKVNQSVASTIAITSRGESTLGRSVDCAILLGRHTEACSLNLAPTSSTTAMMAIGDALTLVTSEQRGFSKEQFSQFHPGGSLGRKLSRVEDVMRPLAECRLAPQHLFVREVLVHVSRPGRRTGAIMLTGDSGELAGVFTDSDLARRLESGDAQFLGEPIKQVMSRDVRVAQKGCLLTDVIEQLTAAKISELPVVDDCGKPIGIVDVTDVIGFKAPSDSRELPVGESEPAGGARELGTRELGTPTIIPIHRIR